MENIKRRKLSAKERNQIFKMFGGKCAYCGCTLHNMSAMQVDHKNPLYIGGTDNLDNMYPTCRSCNNYKRSLDIEKFREYLEGLTKRLKRDNVAFNVAVRFGIVEVKEKPVVFYFEKAGVKDVN